MINLSMPRYLLLPVAGLLALVAVRATMFLSAIRRLTTSPAVAVTTCSEGATATTFCTGPGDYMGVGAMAC